VNRAERCFVPDGWNVIRNPQVSSGGECSDYYVGGLDLPGTLQEVGGVGGLLMRIPSLPRRLSRRHLIACPVRLRFPPELLMDKSRIITAILERISEDFETRQRSSKKTRAEGNHEESKAESKYDTLAIEENYLADGFARQALAAAKAGSEIRKLPVVDFAADASIDLGALVEVQFGESREWFFIAPSGGGIEVVHDGVLITVLTPESPLGSRLVGGRAADRITAPTATILRVI